MNQNKVLFYLRLVISNDFGVLEYWSDGAMDKVLTSFFQYSITPAPVFHDSGSQDLVTRVSYLKFVYRTVKNNLN